MRFTEAYSACSARPNTPCVHSMQACDRAHIFKCQRSPALLSPPMILGLPDCIIVVYHSAPQSPYSIVAPLAFRAAPRLRTSASKWLLVLTIKDCQCHRDSVLHQKSCLPFCALLMPSSLQDFYENHHRICMTSPQKYWNSIFVTLKNFVIFLISLLEQNMFNFFEWVLVGRQKCFCTFEFCEAWKPRVFARTLTMKPILVGCSGSTT